MSGSHGDGFRIRRELLLTEIERRCSGCGAPARPALTKEEARDYTGFECEPCGLWNDDELTERDVPEWWEEIRVTGLDALKPPRTAREADARPEPDALTLLGGAWRREAEELRGAGRAGGPREAEAAGEVWEEVLADDGEDAR